MLLVRYIISMPFVFSIFFLRYNNCSCVPSFYFVLHSSTFRSTRSRRQFWTSEKSPRSKGYRVSRRTV